MSKPYPKYDEEFKKNLVELHKNGKSQSQLHNEYDLSHPRFAPATGLDLAIAAGLVQGNKKQDENGGLSNEKT